MSKPKQERNIQIPNDILKKLLTSSELRMLKNRYQIMRLLVEGSSVRSVASQVKVGTDTVVRVARMIENGRKPLKAKKIPLRSSTTWIIGKKD